MHSRLLAAVEPGTCHDADDAGGRGSLRYPAHLIEELPLDALRLHEDRRGAFDAVDGCLRKLFGRVATGQRPGEPLVVEAGRIPQMQMGVEYAHGHILPQIDAVVAQTSDVREKPLG